MFIIGLIIALVIVFLIMLPFIFMQIDTLLYYMVSILGKVAIIALIVLTIYGTYKILKFVFKKMKAH